MRTFLTPMRSVMQVEDLFKRLWTVLVQGLSYKDRPEPFSHREAHLQQPLV